jgi:hypothetical protein
MKRMHGPRGLMKRMRCRRKLRSAVLIAVLALGLASVAGLASAGEGGGKNPLAGSWTGMTNATPTWPGPAAPISFRITNSGKVVNLSTTVTLNIAQKAPNDAACLAAAPVAVTMPPVKMNKPSGTYPKGKRFDYHGPSVTPPGELLAQGKVNKGFRKMEGALLIRNVEISPGATCKTGNVHYTVKRAG